jgi:hypothetical protein
LPYVGDVARFGAFFFIGRCPMLVMLPALGLFVFHRALPYVGDVARFGAFCFS